MYGECIYVAILLFYLHKNLYYVTDSQQQQHFAIYSISTRGVASRRLRHHLLLEVMDSFCSKVFDIIWLISVPGQ